MFVKNFGFWNFEILGLEIPVTLNLKINESRNQKFYKTCALSSTIAPVSTVGLTI